MAVLTASGLATSTIALAAPGQAAVARTLTSVHVSVSAVSGSLPARAGITVIQTCPRGSDLDRALTASIGEIHDGHVAVAGRQYWPAGVVTRYRVGTPLSGAREMTLAAGAIVCRIHVGRHTRTVVGTATTDVRIWGPAPSRVNLLNATVMAVVRRDQPGHLLRTTVQGSGVGSSRGSLRHAVTAVQHSLNGGSGIGAVVAIGSTTRSVPCGSFASMENRYRFRIAV